MQSSSLIVTQEQGQRRDELSGEPGVLMVFASPVYVLLVPA